MERARFGRQAELARISSFLDAVLTGPEALILEGEAGIGKSALWLDTLAQAQARSYRALSSRPTESEAKLSFAALGDLLDGVVDEVLDALPPPQRSALEVALLRAGGHHYTAGSPDPLVRVPWCAHGPGRGASPGAGDRRRAMARPSVGSSSGVRDPAAARRADRDPHHGARRRARPPPARSGSSAPGRTDPSTARRSDHDGGDPRPLGCGALDAAPSRCGPPDPCNGGRESLPRTGARARPASEGDRPRAPAARFRCRRRSSTWSPIG